MLENIARQQAAYLKMHGVGMPPSLLAHTLSTMIVLQSLYFEDAQCESRPELSCASFYKSIAPNSSFDLHTLSQSLSQAAAARLQLPPTPCSTSLEDITQCGYAMGRLPPPQVADICDELVSIQSQLSCAGLPPQFVFVFDAAWLLIEHMWTTAAADVLGEDCVMEVKSMPLTV